ncbi:MAG: hypothetical protein ISS19_13580 [Bacteroidales bacterium]|nr:hypothetical protein [Bacteroidales bacterium]
MKKYLIWIITVLLTLFAATYQRVTGPTYPKSYSVEVESTTYSVRFPRSHGGDTDKRIRIPVENSNIEGKIVFRRFPTKEPWDTIQMEKDNKYLAGHLPGQPPAGKLEYYVLLGSGNTDVQVNPNPVVIRFKGSVPGWVLIPHILFVFAAMLFSSISGFFSIFRYPKYKLYAYLTVIMIVVGGFVLGPVIQKYAFGAFWTGFPFGQDLTDNKILFAFVFWLAAIIGNIKKERHWMVILAASLYLVINFIPHSLLGSELDVESGEVITGMIPFISIF